jgi:hypothetical protein
VLRSTLAAVAAVSLAAVVFATAATAGPPTSGIIVNCGANGSLDGQTTVSGFKGNPSKILVLWKNSSGQDISGSGYYTNIGGKYGHLFSVGTPATASSVEVSIWYGTSATYAFDSGMEYCQGQ